MMSWRRLASSARCSASLPNSRLLSNSSFGKFESLRKLRNETLSRPVDRARINVHEVYEVEYWTKKFGCNAEQLKAAVKNVGVMAKDIEAMYFPVLETSLAAPQALCPVQWCEATRSITGQNPIAGDKN